MMRRPPRSTLFPYTTSSDLRSKAGSFGKKITFRPACRPVRPRQCISATWTIPRARSLTWRRAPEPSDCLRIWEPSPRGTTFLKGGGMADERHSHDPDAALFQPILQTGKSFYLAAGALGAGAAWSVFAWLYQLTHGLGATGLGRPIYWGLYITNFVFFIGISHAGTLISAILRLCHAEWRRGVTPAAEGGTLPL